MKIIENLPFYDDYISYMNEKNQIEKEIEVLEAPEKQLEHIKSFYNNIGAYYSKNRWITEIEENISETKVSEDGHLIKLKEELKFCNILKDTVKNPTGDGYEALSKYGDNENRKELVNQVKFYVGVYRVRIDSGLMEKAGSALEKQYNSDLFIQYSDNGCYSEGVYYYILYLQSLKACLENYRGKHEYDDIRNRINDRCYNIRLKFNSYKDNQDAYIPARLILKELSDVETFMKADNE